MRSNRREGHPRLAAQITMSACVGNLWRSVESSPSTPSASSSVATRRSRSMLRALSITRFTTGANDAQSCVSQVTLFERAHLFDALHDESNGQRIAGREHGIVFFRKLVEIAFDQNGAESAEAHDFGSGLDRAGRGRSDASEVLVHIGGFQTVGRNETVDVQAARVSSSPRVDVDMADRSRRDPGKDVLDLVVGERCKFPSAQDSEDVRRRSPTLLMADQREIDLDRRLSPS